MYLNPATPAVAARQAIEVKIVKAVVNEALKQGYSLSVYDGETEHKPTTDKATLIKQLMNTDEDYLFVRKDGRRAGWILFVYGNSGWDVISDYASVPEIKSILIPANKIADSYDDLRPRSTRRKGK